jgi:predicted RNA binding protein YcfA (HicA-like mRNA interferase family)
MLTKSRDIIRRLERDGWQLERISGSHHVYKKPGETKSIVVPHPKKDFSPGIVLKFYKQAGWPRD